VRHPTINIHPRNHHRHDDYVIHQGYTRSPSSKSSTTGSTTTNMIEYDDMLPNPHPSLEPLDVVHLCMETLMAHPNSNEGLEVCFHFSSDRLRAPFQGSLEKFVQHATNPIFGSLVKCTSYNIVNVGPVIAGTPTRGAMQTFLMDVQAPKSDLISPNNNSVKSEATEERRYLWTLQKERRPPRCDCWLVHECLFVKYAFQLTE